MSTFYGTYSCTTGGLLTLRFSSCVTVRSSFATMSGGSSQTCCTRTTNFSLMFSESCLRSLLESSIRQALNFYTFSRTRFTSASVFCIRQSSSKTHCTFTRLASHSRSIRVKTLSTTQALSYFAYSSGSFRLGLNTSSGSLKALFYYGCRDK